MVGQSYWAKTPFDDLRRWLYNGFFFLRACLFAAYAHCFSSHPRHGRRSFTAALTGRITGGVPNRKAWAGHGILGARDCCGSNPGARAGGWLTDSYSWRWVFYINIPVGIASIIMTKLFIFDPHYIRRREGGIDYWGLGMLALGIGALQIVLDRGQQEDWLDSPWVRSLVVVTLVALVLFVFVEFRTRAPVVNLRVFRDRTYAMGTLFMTVLGFVLFGSLVLLPLWLQTLLGYPSVQAGEAMSPRGLGSFLAMPIVGMLLAKYDPRKFLAIGISIAALTLWQFSRLNLNAGYWDFFWPQLIQGVSLGFIFVPLTTITMGSIPKEQMGNATSIFNLLRNLGGSLGIASVATLLDRFQQAHLNLLVSHITPYSSQAVQTWEGATGRMWLHGIPLATAQRQGYAAVWGAMQRQAAILTFLDIFRLLALIFLVLIPFVLIMKKPVKPSKTVASH